MLCQSERGFPDKESPGPDKRSCSPGQHLHCVRLQVISSRSRAMLASLTLGEIVMAPFPWLAMCRGLTGKEQSNAVAEALSESGRGGEGGGRIRREIGCDSRQARGSPELP